MYERASRAVDVFTAPKTLVRSGAQLRTRKVVLAAGTKLASGAVLGILALGVPTAAAKTGGNTGTGTFTLDASPLLARAKAGVYTLRCTVAAANGGTFRLEDPDGVVLGDIALPGQANGTIAVAEQVKGTLADGGTDFVVGDGFDITVPVAAKVNGMDRARLATAAAADGSQEPNLVLAYDVEAGASELETIAYESGDFVREALVFGAGLTADGTREALRRRNITFG